MPEPVNSFDSLRALPQFSELSYFDVRGEEGSLDPIARHLPMSLKVLLENLLRHEDGVVVTRDDIIALASWPKERHCDREVQFYPARVLMPDSSGTPLLADLSAMRDALEARGVDPARVNPLIPVDVVIDHSVTAEHFGSSGAYRKNIELEFEQNKERYTFLRWAQKAYDNVRIIPPGTGIVHQINMEYLAIPVRSGFAGSKAIAFPDSLVGMDSHTPMINALGVMGWGVGGIEAGSAMLGEPISMIIPDVVGCRLTGRLREGVTSTDLALTVTQRLRAASVVGKIVEFCGPGLANLTLPDRASLANMAPEYGANMGFFPIDAETIRYLAETGRDSRQVALTEAYARAQGLWAGGEEPAFSDVIEIDLGAVEASAAGPRRPQDRVPLGEVPAVFASTFSVKDRATPSAAPEEGVHHMQNGDIVIAAITSCTNTSNPSVMLRAGLLARNAAMRGLRSKPWVKTTLSPGSRVVSDYLAKAGLQEHLNTLGFHLTGYGCMTCGGGAGSLPEDVEQAIQAGGLKVATVLSGNRNFEGRIHRSAVANFLVSPPLVVAYAIAGTVLVDLQQDPLGWAQGAAPVYLRDIWPSDAEVQEVISTSLTPEMFAERYGSVFDGGAEWRALAGEQLPTFAWDSASTYLKQPPYFQHPAREAANRPEPVEGARILALLGDSITTDHISPVGSISPASPAGAYLRGQGVPVRDFNTYLTRRANHEVMIRGTFDNARLANEMVVGSTGGVTRHLPSGETVAIYEAASRYIGERTPLVIVAGVEYGTGSSRDWAAKGTALLGVSAVIAESFERIHRSNLVGMGVVPLEFPPGTTRKTLGLDGSEVVDIAFQSYNPRSTARVTFTRSDGRTIECELICRMDTMPEINWYKSGGILPYVLEKLTSRIPVSA